MQEVFGFVKRNLSEAQRRDSAASGVRGAGKGAAALVPASAHSGPEREKRSVRKLEESISVGRRIGLAIPTLLKTAVIERREENKLLD